MDQLAKEAATMRQQNIALDFMTIKASVKLHVKRKWREAVLARKGIYYKGKCEPASPTNTSDA